MMPERAASKRPVEDMVSACFSSPAPSALDMAFPLPYPNQKPSACMKLTKLKAIPMAAVMLLLPRRPMKKVSVRLYIVITSIPMMVGTDMRIRSGSIGCVRIFSRLNFLTVFISIALF